jgi:hypothetical protein
VIKISNSSNKVLFGLLLVLAIFLNASHATSMVNSSAEVDSTPPNQPSVSDLPTITNQDSVVVHLSGEPNTQIWVNQHNSNTLIPTSGSINITLNTSAESTSIDFSISLKDNSGNESEMLVFTILKDIIAPNKPWLTTIPLITKESEVVIKVNGEVDSKVFVNQVNTSVVIPLEGKTDVVLDTSGDNNEKSFAIALKDSANNQSEKLEFVIKIDRIKPNEPILATPNYINTDRFNVNVRGEPGALVKINGISSAIVIPENGEITIELDINNGNRLAVQQLGL